MAEKSTIEWTDATWNPITGCSIVSPGCTNCYAMRLAGTRLKNIPSRIGLTQMTKAGPVWNGDVRFNEGWLDQPLKWKRARRVFVCAHGDLFAEGVPDAWIDKVFAVMALSPQHTFQVLTKRPARMLDYVKHWFERLATMEVIVPHPTGAGNFADMVDWIVLPAILPNVWLGTSTERQQEADERIPLLLRTPAAVRFISAEPLLGPINLEKIVESTGSYGSVLESAEIHGGTGQCVGMTPALDWVIVGGESGPGWRPMAAEWADSIGRQCKAAGVAFFMKQMAGKKPIPPGLLVREFPGVRL